VVAVKRKQRKRADHRPDRSFEVGDDESPFPFNLTLKGLPFPPYTCSTCGFSACAEEFDITDRSLPLVTTLGHETFSICPHDEGPDRAELLSPAKDSYRYRVIHKIRGREVTACILGGILERNERSSQSGTLLSEEDLMLELYLRSYIEDAGHLDDLDLECLVNAPFMTRPVGKSNAAYLTSRQARHRRGEWEQKADRLGFRLQGTRKGLHSGDIARAFDPRLGVKLLAANRYLYVPFELSLPLQEQWEETLPWLDRLADYAYRFTRVKRPRRRPNMYRDIYIFLSVAVERRSVFSVGRELFPKEQRLSRETKVRAAVRQVRAVVRKAGIELPTHGDKDLTK
jgi:hypothetical protein